MADRPRPTALEAAQRLLAAREKTRAQLEQALLRKGYAHDEVLDVIARLATLGLLSDRRAAELHARKGFEAKQSTAAVTRKLTAIGVAEDEVEEVVVRVQDDVGHDDEAAARALLEKRRLSGVKAARFLASRGFDEALVRRLVRLDEGE
ncbi:MAG: recombination regulator RecX [Myxococcaceae bacterium]|jgi:regulatory protein|nr:recombination regulator RecX [Myxococcaceae bacterium]